MTLSAQMEAHHKQAINELWQTLIERLVPSVDSYISYLGMHRVISMADQQRIRNTCVTNEEKLPNVLHLIQGKDKSWESTITYLRGNNFETLAKQLEIAASTALSSTGDS